MFCTLYKPKDREKVTAKWVVENTTDVMLVNLIGSGGINHVVFVDARPEQRVIYDSMERHPIALNEESLHCCIGDGQVWQHVYVRFVIVMP